MCRCFPPSDTQAAELLMQYRTVSLLPSCHAWCSTFGIQNIYKSNVTLGQAKQDLRLRSQVYPTYRLYTPVPAIHLFRIWAVNIQRDVTMVKFDLFWSLWLHTKASLVDNLELEGVEEHDRDGRWTPGQIPKALYFIDPHTMYIVRYSAFSRRWQPFHFSGRSAYVSLYRIVEAYSNKNVNFACRMFLRD